jgi:hypothetical protein
VSVIAVLCALTSLTCAVMLWRGYRRSGMRLLFWSAVCFGGMFLNNALLIVDMRMTQVDLALIRMLPALIGAIALVYGLILDGD